MPCLLEVVGGGGGGVPPLRGGGRGRGRGKGREFLGRVSLEALVARGGVWVVGFRGPQWAQLMGLKAR